jgi:hypothetical protein
MDLIRKLVLAIEEHPHGYAPAEIDVPDYSDEQVGYHLYLLVQGGLATGNDAEGFEAESPSAIIHALTWKGHEFADAARNETFWNKARKTVKEKAGTVGIGVLTELLKSMARSALGI